MPGRKGQARIITAAERRVQALALRKAGLALRDIAGALGCSATTVLRDVQAALLELASAQQGAAAELRTLESERLDALQVGLWAKATSGDVPAALAVLKISESRRRLFGLDLQPGALLPGDMAIVLRWPDGRDIDIIDATPADDHAAAAPQLPAGDSAAPGALSYRVRWQTLGQVEAGGSPRAEDGAGAARQSLVGGTELPAE